MRFTALRIICLVFVVTGALRAATPDPPFPEIAAVQESPQTLNKLGEYRYVYRLFFPLYDVALYAESDASEEAILRAEKSFQLHFRYLREIEKPIILKSADTMLKKNLSPEEYVSITERVKAINKAYQTVRDGDHSSLTYLPGRGTTLSINGEPVITIEGQDFGQLYFQIWLGSEPISRSLKENLLQR